MRQKASWLLLTLLSGAAVLQPGGCAGPLDPGKTGPGVDEDLLSGVLIHARAEIRAELDAMQAELDALDAAVAGWQAAPEDVAALDAARGAFESAMLQWGVLDALQVGPAAPSLDSPAGQDLRDAVYSWPTVSPCRVDQETVSGDYTDAAFFEQELVNVYGLDALEHLLYAPSENACPSQVDINAEGTWADMGPTALAEARADYAAAVIGRLRQDVGALQDAWAGGFGDDFVTGAGVYGGPEDALDDLYRAMFYIEAMKDEKLAFPMGLRECASPSCPELAESQTADLSAGLLRANLSGLAIVLAPVDGIGFVDLLEDAGEGDQARALRDALADAEAALAPLVSVRDQVGDDDGTVQAAYDAVAALATLLESDVATTLELSVPSEAAGDAD